MGDETSSLGVFMHSHHITFSFKQTRTARFLIFASGVEVYPGVFEIFDSE
jgi:hypothetical protein